MANATNNKQIQIRIDGKTKREAKKILDELGMDISSAVKIFFKQIINTRNFPCEIRDANGFSLKSAEILRESIREGRESKKIYKSSKELIKDALK